MTTGQTTFGANQAAEIEVQQMATSLDNLANASIQKNTTIDNNLVATNATFSKVIQDIQRTVATMMTNQAPMPGTPAAPGQHTGE